MPFGGLQGKILSVFCLADLWFPAVSAKQLIYTRRNQPINQYRNQYRYKRYCSGTLKIVAVKTNHIMKLHARVKKNSRGEIFRPSSSVFNERRLQTILGSKYKIIEIRINHHAPVIYNEMLLSRFPSSNVIEI